MCAANPAGLLCQRGPATIESWGTKKAAGAPRVKLAASALLCFLCRVQPAAKSPQALVLTQKTSPLL